MRRAFVVLVGLAGCTAANPNYVAGSSGGSPVGGVGAGGAGGLGSGGIGGLGGSGGLGGGGSGGVAGSDDMSIGGGAVDLAMHPPDLSHPGECGPSDRSCTSMPYPTSENCVDNMFAADRTCPFASLGFGGSSCMNGYCKPPTGQGVIACPGTGGGRDITCTQQNNPTARALSCQPFVTDAAKGTISWVCAVAATTARGTAGDTCTAGSDCHSGFCGANGTCFMACQGDNDCPGPIGCGTTKITVEGVTISTRSCIP